MGQYYQRFEGNCYLHLMLEVTQLFFLTIIINFYQLSLEANKRKEKKKRKDEKVKS
jgi:hypothetical protein